MKVTCSHCKSSYPVEEKIVRDCEHSVIVCKNCSRKIKVAFCPGCGAFYAITFTSVNTTRYSYKCKKCSASFIIEFPFEVHDKKPKRSTVRIQEKPDVEEKRDSSNPESTDIFFTGKTISSFTLNGILGICADGFKKSKAGVSFLCIFLALTVLAGLNWLMPMGSFYPESRVVRLMIYFLPLVVASFFYFLASAIVSKITIDEIFDGSLPPSPVRGAIFKGFIPGSAFNSISVFFILGIILVTAGAVPHVGPLVHSLLFFPLYIVSCVLVLSFFAGLWFYPPVMAYRNSGFIKSHVAFFHFLKKHNFRFVFILPVMLFLTVLIVSFMFFIHYAAVASVQTISGKEFSEAFAFVTSFSGSIFGIIFPFSSPVSELSSAGNFVTGMQATGIFSGISLVMITTLFLSLCISVCATVSTHVYVMLERGIDSDDRSKLVLLAILVLMIAGISFLKLSFF